jgi:hypothetical protein
MKLIEINFHPTDRVLRQFGWICAAGFPLLAWVFSGRPRPWNSTWEDWTWVGILFAAGLAVAATGVVAPRLIKPLFVGLSLITLPIGLIVSELMLLAIFFLLFLPFGLVFKLIGRDAMERRFEPGRSTYWVAKRPASGLRQYFRQY